MLGVGTMRRMDVDPSVVERIVCALRSQFTVRRVMLFGSHVRGGSRPDSDSDVLAEVESDRPTGSASARRLALYPAVRSPSP